MEEIETGIEGSPLIPTELIIFYVIFLILLLGIIYMIVHWRGDLEYFHHRVKLSLKILLWVKLGMLVMVGAVVVWWLVPQPAAIEVIPYEDSMNVSPNGKVEIIFDRPIARRVLEKAITPEVPGVWRFEDSLYSTHFYRKVVFYPTESLDTDTNYQVNLKGVKNLLGISEGSDLTFEFKTQQMPKVESVSPADGVVDVGINEGIKVVLNENNDRVAEMEFVLEPAVAFSAQLEADKRTYTITPDESYPQGTEIELRVLGSETKWDLNREIVAKRGESKELYRGKFKTKEPPGISETLPSGSGVRVDSEIGVKFSEEMDQSSVLEGINITPPLPGRWEWVDEKELRYVKQEALKYETEYAVKINKGVANKQDGFIPEDTVWKFTTIGQVRAKEITPALGWSGVGLSTPVKITFDQPVDKESAENKLIVSPEVAGDISWVGDTMIFTPNGGWEFSTKYEVRVLGGIKALVGLDSREEILVNFTTQDQTTKLAVPSMLQKYSLSCEIAALRMALAFKGVDKSEDVLFAEVGLDPTPHKDGVWGNPYKQFVGNIAGKQMVDGYGVYWPPIARVANNYRQATDFEGWSVGQLTAEIANGNPVIIWVYSRGGRPTSWKTSDGQNIFAVSGEHAVVAVGFVGKPDDPVAVMVNDPLVGQVHWSRALFDKKWAVFNRAGVVVY